MKRDQLHDLHDMDAWKLASSLVSMGVKPGELMNIAQTFGRPNKGTLSMLQELTSLVIEESVKQRHQNKTSNNQRSNNQTAENVTEWATQIGLEIDDEVDKTLLWIAELAATNVLGSEWQSHRLNDGDVRYYNTITREVVRGDPLDNFLRDLITTQRAAMTKYKKYFRESTLGVWDMASASEKTVVLSKEGKLVQNVGLKPVSICTQTPFAASTFSTITVQVENMGESRNTAVAEFEIGVCYMEKDEKAESYCRLSSTGHLNLAHTAAFWSKPTETTKKIGKKSIINVTIHWERGDIVWSLDGYPVATVQMNDHIPIMQNIQALYPSVVFKAPMQSMLIRAPNNTPKEIARWDLSSMEIPIQKIDDFTVRCESMIFPNAAVATDQVFCNETCLISFSLSRSGEHSSDGYVCVGLIPNAALNNGKITQSSMLCAVNTMGEFWTTGILKNSDIFEHLRNQIFDYRKSNGKLGIHLSFRGHQVTCTFLVSGVGVASWKGTCPPLGVRPVIMFGNSYRPIDANDDDVIEHDDSDDEDDDDEDEEVFDDGKSSSYHSKNSSQLQQLDDDSPYMVVTIDHCPDFPSLSQLQVPKEHRITNDALLLPNFSNTRGDDDGEDGLAQEEWERDLTALNLASDSAAPESQVEPQDRRKEGETYAEFINSVVVNRKETVVVGGVTVTKDIGPVVGNNSNSRPQTALVMDTKPPSAAGSDTSSLRLSLSTPFTPLMPRQRVLPATSTISEGNANRGDDNTSSPSSSNPNVFLGNASIISKASPSLTASSFGGGRRKRDTLVMDDRRSMRSASFLGEASPMPDLDLDEPLALPPAAIINPVTPYLNKYRDMISMARRPITAPVSEDGTTEKNTNQSVLDSANDGNPVTQWAKREAAFANTIFMRSPGIIDRNLEKRGLSRQEIVETNKMNLTLSEQIVGQTTSISRFVSSLQNRMIDKRIHDEPATRPLASFAFVGPRGSGRHEVVNVAAQSLGRNVKIFDLSDFNECLIDPLLVERRRRRHSAAERDPNHLPALRTQVAEKATNEGVAAGTGAGWLGGMIECAMKDDPKIIIVFENHHKATLPTMKLVDQVTGGHLPRIVAKEAIVIVLNDELQSRKSLFRVDSIVPFKQLRESQQVLVVKRRANAMLKRMKGTKSIVISDDAAKRIASLCMQTNTGMAYCDAKLGYLLSAVHRPVLRELVESGGGENVLKIEGEGASLLKITVETALGTVVWTASTSV